MVGIKTALVNLAAAIALCGSLPAAAALTERECPPSCAATSATETEPGQGDWIVPWPDNRQRQSVNRQRMRVRDEHGAAAEVTGQQTAGEWRHRPRLKWGVMDRWRPRFKDLWRHGY
jgi:hypothetical protein